MTPPDASARSGSRHEKLSRLPSNHGRGTVPRQLDKVRDVGVL
jgi:hypothetical protein